MRKLLGTGLLLVMIIYALPSLGRVYGEFLPPDLPGWELAVHADAQGGNLQDGQAAAVSGEEIEDAAEPMPGETIAVLTGGQVEQLALEDYVEGVVAAEIAPTFPVEAIRAQAVAARTYAVYKMQAGRPIAHPNADICDDFTHCAAYTPLTAQAARWGDRAEPYTDIIQQAVEDTAGEIVTRNGEAIVAVFHAASAQRTEAAKDVWGSEIPYLQSVASPGGSACEKYEGTVTYTAEEFRAKAAENWPTADLSGAPGTWFRASKRSDAGSVMTVLLGGVQVKGTDVRTVFGLNSANFTLTVTDDSISFHTVGYGHGVGLSQYGARCLAEQGMGYKDILTHFYTGTEITELPV